MVVVILGAAALCGAGPGLLLVLAGFSIPVAAVTAFVTAGLFLG